MNGFTHGGYPEFEAWTWTHENQQRLGKIVTDLDKGNDEEKKRAYVDFYEMKRYFMLPVWDKLLFELDKFRRVRGFKTIPDMLDQVSRYMITGVMPEIDSQPPLQEESAMSEGLKLYCEGLRLQGQGLVAMAEEIASRKGVFNLLPASAVTAAAMSPVTAAQETATIPETMTPPPALTPAAETIVEPPKSGKGKKAAEPAPAPAEEVPGFSRTIIDYVKLRAECVELTKQAASKNKPRTIEVIQEAGAPRVTEVKDENLVALKVALEKIVRG